MKVAIVGSRGFLNYNYLVKSMQVYFGDKYVEQVISGGARGADTLGKRYADEHEIPYHDCPADWDRLGKSAGYVRNAEIVQRADVVAAYWDGSSRGTKNTIYLGLNSPKPTLIFLYKRQQIVTLNWEPMLGDLLK